MFMDARKNWDIEKARNLILLNEEITENGVAVICSVLPVEKKHLLPPEKRMPMECPEQPVLEVYRAGAEPIELPKTEFPGRQIRMLPGGFMTGTSSSSRSAACTKQNQPPQYHLGHQNP